MSGTETLAAPPPAASTRRTRPRARLGGRLSGGHVLMALAALLAMLLNFSLLRAGDDRVQVAVAARPLAAGAPVAASSLRFSAVGVGTELARTLISPEQAGSMEGWVAAHDLAAGALVGLDDLRRPGAPAQLRAMSIPIEPGHAVAGQLQAGDRVDVIQVAAGTASYILVGAEVVGVAGGGSAALGALDGFSVTVALDDAQALRLAEAIRAEAVEIVRSTGAPAAVSACERVVTEPELAVAASPREWSQRLYRYVVDHGGARLRATILSPQDALGERYDVFVVDDTTSYLSRRLVNELRAQGRRILGVYDPDDPAGKDDLLAIGVDDVVERSASPEEILRAVTALVRSTPIRRQPAGAVQAALQPPSPQSAGRITAVAAVSGGCGATEVAIGLAAALADRSETCVLVDADDVAPSVAQRLATPMYPNLRAAVDLIQSASGELESTLARPLGAGFGVLAGMSARTGWFESRPSELLALTAALARRHAHVMLNLGPRLEDVAAAGGQTRYGHTRALLAAADVVVGVGLPDPVGVARLLDWVVEARTLAPSAPLHLVLNRAGASAYTRAEVAAELGRSVTPASLSFLPFDGRVPAAGWAGEPVAGGPFARAVARLADTALPLSAGVGRRRWRR